MQTLNLNPQFVKKYIKSASIKVVISTS